MRGSMRGSQDCADWWTSMAVCRNSGCVAGNGKALVCNKPSLHPPFPSPC